MRITTPNAILISAVLLALAILFRIDGMSYINSAKAEVAGMSYYDLKLDYDFKKAVGDIVDSKIGEKVNHYDYDFKREVEAVVEKCKIRDSKRSYLYSGDLTC